MATNNASSTSSTVAVVGPGAVGVTYAAGLQQAGRSTTVLCGRTATDRITLERSGRDPVQLTATLITDPSRLDGPVDWVLLAVKAHQTPACVPLLDRLCGQDTVVAVLQNGVEHRERVEPLVGPAHVLPAIVWCAAEVIEPGRVFLHNAPRLVVPDEPAAERFAQLFAGSDVTIERTADFVSAAWLKLLYNAVVGLEVLAGRRAEIFRIPALQALAHRFADECTAVARADGAVLDDDIADVVVRRFVDGPPDGGTSILYDRLADRPLEWDARNEVIRRIGARHGVPTPVSDVLVPLLQAASNERTL